jgi:hypothetical protein
MNYLLTPLHKHADLGFGATADSYKDAADYLEVNGAELAHFNGHLPINFLRRHAIELYLKSGIIIFHRVLKLPFGTKPWDSDPMVRVNGTRWRPLYKTHSIKTLHDYFSQLFIEHQDFLASHTRANWSFSSELVGQINTIEVFDPDGTHSRYPVTKDAAIDQVKSSIAEKSWDELLVMKEEKEPVKAFLIVNDNDEIVQSFSFNRDPMPELTAALRAVAEIFHNCHAAMRGELTGTF